MGVIHKSLVHPPLEGPEMRKAFPCHNVTVNDDPVVPNTQNENTTCADPYINKAHFFIGNTTPSLCHTSDNIWLTKWIITSYVHCACSIECFVYYTEFQVYGKCDFDEIFVSSYQDFFKRTSLLHCNDINIQSCKKYAHGSCLVMFGSLLVGYSVQ